MNGKITEKDKHAEQWLEIEMEIENCVQSKTSGVLAFWCKTKCLYSSFSMLATALQTHIYKEPGTIYRHTPPPRFL